DPITLVGILVVPLRKKLVEPFTAAGPFGAAAVRNTHGPNRAAHHYDDDQAEKVHGGLVGFEYPPLNVGAKGSPTLHYNEDTSGFSGMRTQTNPPRPVGREDGRRPGEGECKVPGSFRAWSAGRGGPLANASGWCGIGHPWVSRV